jgi:hypothetical protein
MPTPVSFFPALTFPDVALAKAMVFLGMSLTVMQWTSLRLHVALGMAKEPVNARTLQKIVKQRKLKDKCADIDTAFSCKPANNNQVMCGARIFPAQCVCFARGWRVDHRSCLV